MTKKSSSKRSFKEQVVHITLYILQGLVDIVRFIRYIFLLPLSPILIFIVKKGLKRLGFELGKDIVFHNWRTMARIAAYGDIGAAESYVEGWWESDHFDKIIYAILYKMKNDSWILTMYRFVPWRLELNLLWEYFNRNTKSGHLGPRIVYDYYSWGEDFLKYISDSNLVHSTGFYANGATSIEEAQRAKLELLGRKLQLEPGMQVLDVGCGYGAVSKFLADKYDVHVVGITNCPAMADAAAIRCKESRVTIQCKDWRDLDGTFDRIVCVEMAEHVGRYNYPKFIKKLRSLLKPRGIYVIQQWYATVPHYYQCEVLAKLTYGQLYSPDVASFMNLVKNEFWLVDFQDMTYDTLQTYRDIRALLEQNKEEVINKYGIKVYRLLFFVFKMNEQMLKLRSAGLAQYVFYNWEEWDRYSDFARENMPLAIP